LTKAELLGLTFEDVDYEKRTITIRQSWVESEDSKVPVLKDCKTDGSFRKIVVSEETIRLIKRAEIRCKERCLATGKQFSKTMRVVHNKDLEPFRPKSMTRKWAETLKRHKLRHIKLHGTRHSAISWMLSQGIPLHIVQQRAGHQDPKITLSVYSHVAKEDEGVVANLLDNKLFSAVNE